MTIWLVSWFGNLRSFLAFGVGNTFELQGISCLFIESSGGSQLASPAKQTIITVTCHLEGEAGRAGQRFPKNFYLSRTWLSESLQTAKCQQRSQHQGHWGDTRDFAAWVCLPSCSLSGCFQTSPLLFCLDEEDVPCFLRQAPDF